MTIYEKIEQIIESQVKMFEDETGFRDRDAALKLAFFEDLSFDVVIDLMKDIYDNETRDENGLCRFDFNTDGPIAATLYGTERIYDEVKACMISRLNDIFVDAAITAQLESR